MQARAILFSGIDKVSVEEVELPPPGPGEVLVETHFSTISPGTELRCLMGLQQGAPDFPFVPGYQGTGRVIEVGDGVTMPVGTMVFNPGTRVVLGAGRCWGGHISHAVVEENSAFPLPPGVDPLDASIAKLAAIAYHGFRLSRPLPHETVALVGLGPLGQLSARLHTLSGAHVVAADISEERVTFARQSGLEARLVERTLAETFGKFFPDGVHLVVDVTGVASLFSQSVGLARTKAWDDSVEPAARVLLQGSYPDDFTANYQELFRKELSLLVPRDQQPRDIREVLGFLARGTLKVRDIISDVRPVAHAAESYGELRAAKQGLLTVAFDWLA